MTDSVPSSNDSLESFLAQYEAGVTNYETSDILSWLNARGEIENRYDELTPEQTGRLETADSELVEKAGPVAARLAATPGGSLRELRQATPHPSDQWWWYLDVLSHVSDHYEAGNEAKPPASTASRLLTIVELVVLAIAIFLLVQRLLPAASAPASTPIPTSTPAPTETLDPSAFDLSTATTFKAPNDVLEILLPKSWKVAPATTPGRYSFYYGNDQSPSVYIQISIAAPSELIQAATPPATANDALTAIRNSFQSQIPPGSKFTDNAPVKIGKLDGTGFTLSIPDSAGQPGAQLDARIAPLPGGKVVFVYTQAGNSSWTAAKPTVEKMLDSLVVNANAIPTPTLTATPIGPELTLTALQAQIATVQATIAALTPSPTPLPTQQPTGPATSAPTPAATSGS